MIKLTRQELIDSAWITLQREGQKRGIVRQTPYHGIEQVLTFKTMHKGDPIIVRPSAAYLDAAGVDAETMWAAGLENVRSRSVVFNMAEVLGTEDIGLQVITSRSGAYGACAILAADTLLQPGRYYAIPSSVHEFIIMPADLEEWSLEEVGVMIRAINADHVSEGEQLGDHAYVLEVEP